MTKRTEYKRLSAKECAERLLKIENPAVLIHVRPDGDAVGSASALCEIFNQLGKKCRILSADKIPARLDFVLTGSKAEICSNEKDFEAIAIDVASPGQLGALYEKFPAPMLMIDHHAVGEQFADGYIAPEASSAAEALLDVVLELIECGYIKMTGELAFALYAAISSDTGCFAYSNTSPKTHRCAAMLIESGIDSAYINHRLFNSKTPSQIKAEGIVSSKLKCDKERNISYAAITLDELEGYELSAEDFETAIDIVRSVEGTEIAFVVKETERGKYKISLRSVNSNVAKIAAELGGGGHIRAAGCTVCCAHADDAVNIIFSKIKEAEEDI